MRKLTWKLWGLWQFGLAALVWMVSSMAIAQLQNQTDRLIQQLDPTIHLGGNVLDLTTGSMLYQRLSKTTFVPASNMKLFSNAAALLALGPDYRLTNILSMHASQIESGVLEGDLGLILSGDPSFSYQRLEKLLQALQPWHIKKIHGNIIIQSTHASVSPNAPGWDPKDLTYSYGAPIAPVMLDANRMTVTVNPGKHDQDPVLIEFHDPSHTVVVNNEAKTSAQNKSCALSVGFSTKLQLTVKGCMVKGQSAYQQGLAIQNPWLYLQGSIRQILASQGIVLEGEIQLGSVPSHSMVLGQDQSKTVAQLMSDTLKPSDNLYADSLFLHAAMVLKGQPVDWQEAGPVIRQFLQAQTGVDLSQAVMVDGSGLSRLDRVTPLQTVSLLEYLYQKFPLTYEYIAALPVSGRDGTLENRLKDPSQQDFVRAKTGTMMGVNSLSGYIYTTNGHTLAFALYSNRLPKVTPKMSARKVIDRLCNFFLKQEPAHLSWAKIFSPHQRVSFQQHPSQAQQQDREYVQLRKLEVSVKKALKQSPVAVVYRGSELMILDDEHDPSRVYRQLLLLSRTYPFALAVMTRHNDPLPDQDTQLPILRTNTWSDNPDVQNHNQRIWIVRQVINKA
jgi:D-alanyl-D-alanine carboxypeptidase/D-alanyl-D-alanine-endopeptidase (penicillin-binding protein 4)